MLLTSENLSVLIRQLLQEPYATARQFADKDLESVCQEIEKAADAITEAADAESYQRCKAQICLILADLDLQGISDFPKGNLKDFSEPAAQEGSAFLEFQSPRGQNEELPAPTLSLTSDEKEEWSLTGPLGPESAAQDLTPLAGEIVIAASTAQEAEPDSLDWSPMVPSMEDAVLEPLTQPPMENKLESAFPDFPMVIPSTETETSESIPEFPLPEPDGGLGDAGQVIAPIVTDLEYDFFSSGGAFLKIAGYFSDLKSQSTFPLTGPYLDRLLAQHYCLEVEDRIAKLLAPSFVKLWPMKESAVGNVLVPESPRIELLPSLRKKLDALAVEHADWLMEPHFSHAAASAAIKYVLASPRAEKFHPSPMEAGVLILFFGQDRDWDGLVLRNDLGLPELSELEAIELAFRLFRVQRIKSKCLSTNPEFEPSWGAHIEEDTKAILKILARLEAKVLKAA